MSAPRRTVSTLVALALVGAGGAAAGQVGTNTTLVNPNLASATELAKLPGVDPALAATVVEARPHLRPADLQAVLAGSGVSDAQAEALYRHLWVPMNLNTATREEILLVPGVGERMAHEFEEYRPYRALAEFRREIGKYVDDHEVARLEQYVFVPLDLNTASEEDLHTIPGVGDRMVREFLEYRPYVSMEQFRREIGKYVDDAEVARLERFMTIGDAE